MSPKKAAPATRRQKYGNGHGYFIDGRKAPGVTTLLRGVPKNLTGWAAGLVGDFVLDRLKIVDGHVIADELLDDLRKMAATTGKFPKQIPDWRRSEKLGMAELRDYGFVFKGMPFVKRDEAGNRGTEVHKLAQRLAEGEEITVPEELVGHVDAYLKFRDDWEPYDEQVEFVVVNRTASYMGTGDLLCRLARAPELGLCLIDLKTSKGVYDETGLQLAGYRYGESIVDEDGNEQPMPEVDSTLCLHVRSDGYDLIPFVAERPEQRVMLYAGQVQGFLEANSWDQSKPAPAWVNPEAARRVKGEALAPPKSAKAEVAS